MKTREFKSEIAKASLDELLMKRVQLAEDVMRMRFRAAVGQSGMGCVSHLRRLVARVETELVRRNRLVN